MHANLMIALPTFRTEITENAAPEEALALGVLSQAAHDLRRFHAPANNLERELYHDALDWITADDQSWPYSFTNICRLLDVPPDAMRAELLADASLGWLGYWTVAGKRFGRCFRRSLARAFARPRCSDGTVAIPAPQTALH